MKTTQNYSVHVSHASERILGESNAGKVIQKQGLTNKTVQSRHKTVYILLTGNKSTKKKSSIRVVKKIKCQSQYVGFWICFFTQHLSL